VDRFKSATLFYYWLVWAELASALPAPIGTGALNWVVLNQLIMGTWHPAPGTWQGVHCR